jgi:hypothetical protein
MSLNSAKYIHAVNPKGEHAAYACLNLVNAGTLWSADYISKLDPALSVAHMQLKSLPIEALKQAPFPPGTLTPAAIYLLIAALADDCSILRYGDGSPLSPQLVKYSKIRAKKELEFEVARRTIAPQAPSRLSCLWLAEDSTKGRAMLEDIFCNSDLHFLQVSIVGADQLHKGDWNLWQGYFQKANPLSAEKYWRSETSSAEPRWEYLLDGAIHCANQKQISRLCKAHLEANSSPWSSENPPPEALIKAAINA